MNTAARNEGRHSPSRLGASQPAAAVQADAGSHQAAPSRLDLTTKLDARAAQLAALTNLLYADGFPGFKALPDEGQEHVLWLVSDLAEEVLALANRVSHLAMSSGGAA